MNNLNEELIRKISNIKNEPEWMTDFRLEALKSFFELDNPSFGPEIDIDFGKINYYKGHDAVKDNWDEVDSDIKKTFDKLGVIEAEEKYLCGVSNQFESEVVYHKNKFDNEDIIFMSTDEALKKHPELFKKYFNNLVKYNENKYTAINGALWSGGTFIYIPPNTKLDRPLQSYFRINSVSL